MNEGVNEESKRLSQSVCLSVGWSVGNFVCRLITGSDYVMDEMVLLERVQPRGQSIRSSAQHRKCPKRETIDRNYAENDFCGEKEREREREREPTRCASV